MLRFIPSRNQQSLINYHTLVSVCQVLEEFLLSNKINVCMHGVRSIRVLSR